jgi:hypothetical protein
MCPNCSIGPGFSTKPALPRTCRSAKGPCPGGVGVSLAPSAGPNQLAQFETPNMQAMPSGGLSGGEETNGTKSSVGRPKPIDSILQPNAIVVVL